MIDANANGSSHATKAEHESLRGIVEAMREEQKRQAASLKFIEEQTKLTGQALEILLAAQGLDMPETDND